MYKHLLAGLCAGALALGGCGPKTEGENSENPNMSAPDAMADQGGEAEGADTDAAEASGATSDPQILLTKAQKTWDCALYMLIGAAKVGASNTDAVNGYMSGAKTFRLISLNMAQKASLEDEQAKAFFNNNSEAMGYMPGKPGFDNEESIVQSVEACTNILKSELQADPDYSAALDEVRPQL